MDDLPPRLAKAVIASERAQRPRVEHELRMVHTRTDTGALGHRRIAMSGRQENVPQILAACRNTALTVIRRLGSKVVEGLEYFAEYRLAAVQAARG